MFIRPCPCFLYYSHPLSLLLPLQLFTQPGFANVAQRAVQRTGSFKMTSSSSRFHEGNASYRRREGSGCRFFRRSMVVMSCVCVALGAPGDNGGFFWGFREDPNVSVLLIAIAVSFHAWRKERVFMSLSSCKQALGAHTADVHSISSAIDWTGHGQFSSSLMHDSDHHVHVPDEQIC
jgi:hypothetical protein